MLPISSMIPNHLRPPSRGRLSRNADRLHDGIPSACHGGYRAKPLRDQIGAVQDQNLHIVWQSYVHEIFEHNYKHTEARSRQRKMAMAMPAGQAITPNRRPT
jgi:hypothetical protein